MAKEIRTVKIRTLKPGVRGRDIPSKGRKFEENATAYAPTKKVIKTQRIRETADGKDSIREKECPTNCTHLRQRRKKDPEWKHCQIPGEAYCLLKTIPSKCGNSRYADYPLNT